MTTNLIVCMAFIAAACGDNRHESAKASKTLASIAEKRDASAPQTPTPTPTPTPTDALWKLAPKGAVAGLVFADGALVSFFRALDHVGDIAKSDTLLLEFWRSWIQFAKGATAIDFASSTKRRAAGVDAERGAAFFFDATGAPLLAILPVSDAALFATSRGASQTKVSGRAVYSNLFGGSVCAEVRDRFVCADSLSAINAAGSGSILAGETMALPAEHRGDIEFLADIAQIRPIAEALRRGHDVLEHPSILSVAARLRGRRASLRIRLAGSLGAHAVSALQAPGRLPHLEALAANSVTSVRFRLGNSHIGAMAEQLGLEKDAASILTGDVGIYTRGSGVLAGTVALGVTDGVRAKSLVGPLCNSLMRAIGRIETLDASGCNAVIRVPLAIMNVSGAAPLLALLNGMSIRVFAARDVLQIDVGAVPTISFKPQAKAARDPRLLTIEASALDPVAHISADLASAAKGVIASLSPHERAEITAARWVLAHLAKLELSIGIETDGIEMDATLIPFSADPPATYAAYQSAIGKLRAGDRKGYVAALRALQSTSQGSQSLASRVNAEAPLAGPLSLFAAAVVPTLLRSIRSHRASRGR